MFTSEANTIERAFKQTASASFVRSPSHERPGILETRMDTKLDTNEKGPILRSALTYWCERGDLNPHGLPRQILSLVRLPISPLSHFIFSHLRFRVWPVSDLVSVSFRSCQAGQLPFDCVRDLSGHTASSSLLYCVPTIGRQSEGLRQP